MPRDWLYVGKPLRPPFRDGSTVLVAELAAGLDARFDLAYLGDRQAPLGPAHTVIEAPAMGYQPGLGDKARVLATILSPRHRKRALHFFFTPNRVTSRVLAAVRRLQPRRVMVQSVMSAHEVERHVDLLRPLDAVVVLSDHTRTRLVKAGLDPGRITRIHPGVAVPETPAQPDRDRPVVLYAGDLDPLTAERLEAVAHALPGTAAMILACRPKGVGDGEARERLQRNLAAMVDSGRLEILTEVPDMDALLRRASLQLFAADHVRNKVDLPLVLLEGLARGVPVVSLDADPVREIFSEASRLGLEPGAAVPASALAERVREALASEPTLVQWSRDARNLAERAFATSRMVREHEDLYDRLRP